MDVRIWLVGSVIAGVLSWAINRFTKVDDVEWQAATRLQKMGTWASLLLMVVAISPIIAALGYGVIDMVASVPEALIELSEEIKSEKLTLGVPVLVVLFFCLFGYVEYQIQYNHRVGRWIVALRILQKVFMVLIVFMVVSTLVGWAIGAVLLPMMLFNSWQDMVWYQKAGLVVCAAWLCLVVKETVWPRR